MLEQVNKIKKLIQTATNPKQKAMYQELLAKLQAELNIQPNDTTAPYSQTTLTPKPKRTSAQPKTSVQDAKPKPEIVNQELQPEAKQSTTEKFIESVVQKTEPSKTETLSDESQSKSEEPQNKSYFQGIGIIKGEVILTDERSAIKLGEHEYRLFYIPNKRKKAYEALKREIEVTGNTTLRLIVYPKILHLPKKDQPHRVSFQLVGFIGSKAKPSQLNTELDDFEFKFSGLWQFIPVCRTPCISIFRNFNKDRLAWIKEAEAAKKVKFMKSSHVPLLWRDSPVKPFRFNPRLEKEQQGQTYFVQVKAKFLPGRDVFGFVEQLDEPTGDIPGFLKASKKLKAEALREIKDNKQKQKSVDPPKNKSTDEQPKQSEVQSENQSLPEQPKKSQRKQNKQSVVQETDNKV
ncbi:hypothetical protein [Lyngbya sp. PCC 8106]|uniref:hypothetical protein n=1 Tax=Lyngbya sp. (strain PCC 8106) TaxID=313612 RepID=UPI0002E964A3|nr:hypothetical protein [Lyngbya sp. PCC 8106]